MFFFIAGSSLLLAPILAGLVLGPLHQVRKKESLDDVRKTENSVVNPVSSPMWEELYSHARIFPNFLPLRLLRIVEKSIQWGLSPWAPPYVEHTHEDA